jgi:hypothetical protein
MVWSVVMVYRLTNADQHPAIDSYARRPFKGQVSGEERVAINVCNNVRAAQQTDTNSIAILVAALLCWCEDGNYGGTTACGPSVAQLCDQRGEMQVRDVELRRNEGNSIAFSAGAYCSYSSCSIAGCAGQVTVSRMAQPNQHLLQCCLHSAATPVSPILPASKMLA